MNAMTAAELLGATTLPREKLDLSAELGPGKYIWVQGMSGRDRDAFEAGLAKGPRGQRRNIENFRARLAVLCVIHEDGSRMFTASQAEQAGAIRADVLTKIVAVGQRLSGIGEADAEELGKPSDDVAASAASSSNSPSN
jgi:hypothetical protein